MGTMGVLLLFFFWILRVVGIYRESGDLFLSSLLWGVSVSVLIPLFINLGGVLKLMPLTGIPLPFISYGGRSLLFMWARVGLVMRVCRESRETGKAFSPFLSGE